MRCAAILCGPERPALQLGLSKRPGGGSALLLSPSPAPGLAAAVPAAGGDAVGLRGRCCAVAACYGHGSSGAVARSSSSSNSPAAAARLRVRAAGAVEGSATPSATPSNCGASLEALASDPHPASASTASVAAAAAADDTATPTPPAAATAADARASGTVAGGSGPAAAAADVLTAALSGVVGRVVDERLAAGLRGQLVGEVAAALAAEPRLLLGELLLTAAACKADSGAHDAAGLQKRVSEVAALACAVGADVGRLRAEVAELAAWRRGLEQWTPPEKQQVPSEAAAVTPDTARCGLRVQRGPDWDWADSDGGAGGVGTVTQVMDNGWCEVTWDATGGALVYRTGAYRRHDLQLHVPQQAIANQQGAGPSSAQPPAGTAAAAPAGGGSGQCGGSAGKSDGIGGGGKSFGGSCSGGHVSSCSSGSGSSNDGDGGGPRDVGGSGGRGGGGGGGGGDGGRGGGGSGVGGGGGSAGGDGKDGGAGWPLPLLAAAMVGAGSIVGCCCTAAYELARPTSSKAQATYQREQHQPPLQQPAAKQDEQQDKQQVKEQAKQQTGGGRGTSGGGGGDGGGGDGEGPPAGSLQRLRAALLTSAGVLALAALCLACHYQEHQRGKTKQTKQPQKPRAKAARGVAPAAAAAVMTAAAAAEPVARKRDPTLGILLPRYRPVPGAVVAADNVHVGLVVRRGPDWDRTYTNWIEASADGGPGSDGVVKEITKCGRYVWTRWPARGKDTLHNITGERGYRVLVVAPAGAQQQQP